MTTVAVLFGSILLAATGQLLLRAGMLEIGVVELSDLRPLLRGLGGTWQLPLGLAAFGLSAVLWLVTLSRLPLSTAYPVVGLSYVLILLASVLVLGERPSAMTLTGASMVVAGIVLIGWGQR